MSRAEKAQAVLNALGAVDDGMVVQRPKYRQATVLSCQRCGHRFAIVNHPEAHRQTLFPCECGGKVKIIGYYARLEPRSRKEASNG